MKKIITLILAAGLFTTAAFAQDRRSSYNNRYAENSYQTQSPAYNGYNNYGSNWNQGIYGKQFGYNRHDRDRDDRMMYKHQRRYYDNYRNRSGLSLQLIIGNRRRY